MHYAFSHVTYVTHLSVIYYLPCYGFSMFNKMEIYMTKRTIIFLLASVLMTSCASNQPVAVADIDRNVLHIYPDGKMILDGRSISEENVVIYSDGRGGERAAVKLIVPQNRYHNQPHTDFYRDTIVVEREGIEVLDKQGG